MELTIAQWAIIAIPDWIVRILWIIAAVVVGVLAIKLVLHIATL